MLENTIKSFTAATFLAGLLFCGQSLLLGQDNQSTDLFKTVEMDGYSEGLDTIRIKAGPFGKTMQFNVDRLSDPSKPTWSSFDGEWKARVEEFPEEPHLAKWQGKLLSVWRSPAGVTFFLLDMVKVRNGNLSWVFVRSDRLERPLAYFPEAMLEEAISEVLGIDPARLTKKLLADRLVSFELNDANVRDLTGLGDAKNLQVLTLRDNLITDLSPLAGLSKLRRLELRGNRLESLESFKDLPGLVELNLSQNRLNGLSGVEGLTILRKLDVSENDLRDLTGVSTLKNLETLHAQENRLGLVEPFKDQNKNAKFDVGEEFEDLNGNGQWDNDPLPELNDLRALRDLYLYGNSLKNLSGLGSLPSLRTLLLGGNEISDASPLRKYVSLNNLSLNRNQVSDLGQFADLNYLIYLDLAENRLSDLRPLRNMKYLRRLLLNDNNLSDLRPLAGISHLEYLSLDSNLVTNLRPLADLKNLRTLHAARNLIDFDSGANLAMEQLFTRNKVRIKTGNQEKTIDGIGALATVLIGDKIANAKLGSYLENNGYARLRDYHGDKQVTSAQKAESYLKWAKAIRNDAIAELRRIGDR